MVLDFLGLPSEIRIEIYRIVFGSGKVIIEAKDEDDSGCLLPVTGRIQNPGRRSSQLLRVNSTILSEARPILYANTTFQVLAYAFAGRLPLMLTDGHAAAPHVRNLIWQIHCDMLKHHYPEDLQLNSAQAAGWDSLEVHCRAESWRDSFLGEWCDRESFVAGREQMIDYARACAVKMSSQQDCNEVKIVEDRSQLGRGGVIMKLGRRRAKLRPEEFLVN